MENINSELSSLKHLLKSKEENFALIPELIKKINLEDGYFSPGNILNTKQARNTYSIRYKINSTNNKIVGLEKTLDAINNYSDSEFVLYSLTFSNCSYSVFVTIKKDDFLGIVRTNHLNSEKLNNLNEIYSSKNYEVDSVKISKGMIQK